MRNLNKKLFEDDEYDLKHMDKVDSLDDIDVTYTTPVDDLWKRRITAMLINKDGRWGPYKHAKYAERFNNLILKIVPLSVKNFAAAISWENNTMYLSAGLLLDKDDYKNINVIVRHELAHNILQHQLRLKDKLMSMVDRENADIIYDRLIHSYTFHDLMNIIEDLEISNEKYTSEDKMVVDDRYKEQCAELSDAAKEKIHQLKVNGKEFRGLVTEMNRPEWIDLSLEDMYDRLMSEIHTITYAMNRDVDNLKYNRKIRTDLEKNDAITASAVRAVSMYSDLSSKSKIWAPIDEYISTSKVFKKMAKRWQDLIKLAYEELKDKGEHQLTLFQNMIADSDISIPVKITSQLTVYSPEEKYWVVSVIKTLLGNCLPKPPTVTIKRDTHSKEYVAAYNTIIKNLGTKAKCDDETLKTIIGKAFGADID